MFRKIALAALLAAPALASAGSAYLIVGGASGSIDLADIENSYSTPSSADDAFTRAIIGVGAPVNPNLAIEAVYLTNVENNVNAGIGRDELEHGGLQAALLGKAPLTPQFSIFGKISANLMSTTYHYEDNPLTVSVDEEESGAYLGFGFGAEYQASDTVGLRLQVERIQLRDITIVGMFGPEGADFDVDQASLAVTFSF
jgi:hypothetical protein